MKYHHVKKFWAVILLVSLLSSACAHKKTIEPIQLGKGPVELKFFGVKGEEDTIRYYSHSKVNKFEESQMVRARDEIVEFRVKEVITDSDEINGTFKVSTSTFFKDGTVDLHDLAFPEKDEEIDYVFRKNGQVLRAGDYPPTSVFFIPPLPVPSGPVSVGDTWSFEHIWVSSHNGIPLGLQMIAILKGLVACGVGVCVDLEVSGQVDVVGMVSSKGKFTSHLWGRMIVAANRGLVLWSEIRSREQMTVAGSRTDVLSCMVSALETPRNWQVEISRGRICTPSEDPVPGLYNF